MENLIATFSDYYSRKDFRIFQNNLARKVYKSLSTTYSNRANEVKMVTEMSNTIHGKSFDKLKFYSKKIHGPKSYVEFFNQTRKTQKELADMVIISVATEGKEIVYEKTAFIQNKKSENSSWKIDQDQLYLLHNFPTFKGIKGIINKNFKKEVVFQNHSKTLGNYGLFQCPGEMILVNALTVYKLEQNSTISLSEIRKFADSRLTNNNYSFPLISNNLLFEYILGLQKHSVKYPWSFYDMPFLNNSSVSFNIYEFIRNWSLFNIGETLYTDHEKEDNDLSTFNRIILGATELSESINVGGAAGLSESNNVSDNEVASENDLIAFVAHLEIDKKV